MLKLFEEMLSEENFAQFADFGITLRDIRNCSIRFNTTLTVADQVELIPDSLDKSEDTSIAATDTTLTLELTSTNSTTIPNISELSTTQSNIASETVMSVNNSYQHNSTNHTVSKRDVADTIINGLFDVSNTINSQHFDSTYLKQLLRDNAVGKERKELKNQLYKVLKSLMQISFKVGIQHPEDVFLAAINN